MYYRYGKMNILHYSDSGSADFITMYEQCDVMVTTGDLGLTDFAGLDLVANKRPMFGVYGNHDSGNYMEDLGIINLHKRIIEFEDLKWGGWQGCLKYKEGLAPMFSEDEAKEFANTFPYVDVLLLHVGPKGMLDDNSDEFHMGSENIRRYVLEKRPKFVFCGHQYSNDSLEVMGLKIYRTYGARIIEI